MVKVNVFPDIPFEEQLPTEKHIQDILLDAC